jgi:hypothetical protein
MSHMTWILNATCFPLSCPALRDIGNSSERMTSYARPPWFRWWLLPVTSLFHFADELFAAGGFYTWVARIGGTRISMTRFASASLLALLSITVASWTVRKGRYDWLLFTLAATILTNAVTHVLGSVVTHSYSPGTVSGLILWLPLGGMILFHRSAQERPAVWYLGLFLGTVVNFGVLLLTMNLGRIS